jgi:cytochrome c oxidase subunit II
VNNKPTDDRSPVSMILIATGVALALTVLLGWAAHAVDFWFPAQRSTVAGSVDFVFNVITWISIFFFVQIVVLMTWFVIKFRMRDHSKATSDITHNTPLELTWTIIPLILVIAIFYVGLEGYLNLRQSPAGAYEIHATAARWSWTFKHRSGCNQSGVLYIPVNRPVKMIMESSDVLHALFIPAFRVKQDIVPGRITTLWFECSEPGEYDLFCAEYCGKDHSNMYARVIAMRDDEFEAKLQECRDYLKDEPIENYPQLAMDHIYPRCKSCHSLDEKVTATAPSWRGLWAKLEAGDEQFNDGTTLKDLMGDGNMFASPEDYIRKSILDPHSKIVMNYSASMPTFKGQLSDLEIRAVIELFKHLDDFDSTGKRIKEAPASSTPSGNEANSQATPASNSAAPATIKTGH